LNELGERHNKVSLITVLIAVLLAAILVALVVGVITFRQAVQAVEGGTERVFQWGENLAKLSTPTVRPNPATVIYQVLPLSRLETVSYSIEKVVTVEKNRHRLAELLQLDEQLLFVAHGKVIAGLDLSQMRPADITVTEDGTVILLLPAAAIFVATLDNQQSYVYDHARGVLNRIFEEQSDLETLARQAAEDAIAEAALEDGILETARLNGQLYLRSFLLSLGFERVLFAEEPPSAAPETSPTPIPTPTAG